MIMAEHEFSAARVISSAVGPLFRPPRSRGSSMQNSGRSRIWLTDWYLLTY